MGFHDLREMTKARFAEYCAIYKSFAVEMRKILGGIETKEMFGRSEIKELRERTESSESRTKTRERQKTCPQK